MKRICALLTAIAAMVSCTQTELAPEITEAVSSFTVSLATPQPDTRTCLDGNLFKWTKGDELLVSTTGKVAGSAPAPYSIYTTTDDKSESATFYSSAPVGALASGEKYIVMYTGTTDVGTAAFLGQRFDANTGYSYLFASVPSRQTYSPDGLAPYTMPMYAVTESLDNVKMTSLATVLRLKLYGTEGEKVKSIKITSTNGYYIAGTYALGKTAASASGKTYDQDPLAVFNGGNYYFGMWNERSTKSNWGSMDVTLDCGEEGVTLSADPTDPTVFNMVIAHKNGAYPEISVSIQKVGDSDYSNPVKLNIPANWTHNKIYTTTKAIGSFTWQTPTKTIACWGDSFTHYHGGQLYTDYLRSFLGGGWTLYDGGVGGDKSYDIMMRQGSIRWKFADNYALSYGSTATISKKITLENKSNLLPKTTHWYRWDIDSVEFLLPRLINPCVINGVECSLSAEDGNVSNGLVKVMPMESCSDVSGDWITPYGATVTKNADVNIFYIGRNGGYNDYLQLISQVRAMVDFAGGESKPYIVLGFHEPISKLSNSFLHCTDAQFQNEMKAKFGDHYLNLNKEIRSRADELFKYLGMTATADDTSYLNNGNIPYSFYSEDGFHPRPVGYKVIAMLIHDKMVKLGYLQDSYILSTGGDL